MSAADESFRSNWEFSWSSSAGTLLDPGPHMRRRASKAPSQSANLRVGYGYPSFTQST